MTSIAHTEQAVTVQLPEVDLYDGDARASSPALRHLAAITPALPPAPLTAAERGEDWTRRYNCTSTCVMDHAGSDGTPGWHQGPTARVTTPKLTDDQEAGDPTDTILAARVTTVNDDPHIHGIHSTLWLDYGLDTVELDLPGVDQVIDQLETFLPKLRAMRQHLAEAQAGDRPADPAKYEKWAADLGVRHQQWTGA